VTFTLLIQQNVTYWKESAHFLLDRMRNNKEKCLAGFKHLVEGFYQLKTTRTPMVKISS